MRNVNTLLVAIAMSVVALTQIPAQAQDAQTANAQGLRIATGKKGKGYSKLFADMQAICGSQVALTEVETEGGLQNLTTLAANQADLGFVQLDTLQDMKSSDENIGALLAVVPLNSNLLHIVARAEGFTTQGPKRVWPLPSELITVPLAKFSDLRGLPVAVVGSARALGRVLNRRYAMDMQFVDVETDDQALAKLKSGAVAGMLTTSGWPSGPIQKLNRSANVRLLQFDMVVQPPYQLVRKNYENLDTFNHAFLAAPNLLVTRPFSTNGANGKAVATLQNCIQKNLKNLQEGRYEPAWGDVKNVADTMGWPKFVGTGKR
jgi:TRAP-type uncharacterized transport system substrate-binding protein